MVTNKIKCLICKKLFSPTRKGHVCCSKACNHRKQKLKEAENNKNRLSQVSIECKNENCQNIFTPSRGNQLYCSNLCSIRQGRIDWKNRNKEKFRLSENLRKKNKYQNDSDYREERKQRSNTNYHSKSDEEKFDLNKKNREARNADEVREYARKYHSTRSKEDIEFKLTTNLRTLIRSAIKRGGGVKSIKSESLIGCSVKECRDHIEKQFKNGMGWENWDLEGWHIDHIRPCSSFNMKEVAQQRIAFNWRNLRPLWSTENIQKKDNYAPLDELAWVETMLGLGFEGELFLKYEEGNSY
tara:strand:+ start:115 stop:1008 length:894 start_codon:yes stop_codon:yes gene_type:complete